MKKTKVSKHYLSTITRETKFKVLQDRILFLQQSLGAEIRQRNKLIAEINKELPPLGDLTIVERIRLLKYPEAQKKSK